MDTDNAGKIITEISSQLVGTETNHRNVNILFLTSGPIVPSTRFRIVPYVRHLRQDGHRCTVAHSFPPKYDYFPWMGFRPSQRLKRVVRWWHWLQARLSRFDIVYVEREIFDDATTEMEERFRTVCRRMVLDIDDGVFLRQPEKFDRLVPMADLVICGNRFLAEKLVPLNEKTIVIPTCVDMDVYDSSPPPVPHERPVVGWMGTTGNLPYLAEAATGLQRVATDIAFDLKLVTPELTALKDIDLSGVHVIHEPWSARDEVAQLRSMDVGLMPLSSDDEWGIYKCGLKLIQYLAVGIPGIASPVGVNTEILDNNQNGFCAGTDDEWETALRTLLTDENLRRRMGRHGQETVRRRYSIQTCYPVLRDALLEL